MKKPKKSEKLLLDRIASLTRELQRCQRGLEIGQVVALIRAQLMMSQRALAKRAGVPQSTISKIESGGVQANVSTLDRIADALECDLLISVAPRAAPTELRRKQAQKKARQRVDYLQGTMALEEQAPDPALLKEMVDEEARKLEQSSGPELWEE